ncbi:MAG TPA: GGDEF domain-containing protein [Gammaproteobacteria bacterium]|nr:GGDEF domain-containing protein [Gammaproteobacteria bacterium]
MDLQDVDALITYIGILSQAVVSGLLIVLFLFLGNLARRKPYFIQWGRAWQVLTVALLALLLRSSPALSAIFGFYPGGLAALAELFYQVGKMLFFVLLFVGVLLYTRGIAARRYLPVWYGLTIAYGAITVLATDQVRDLLILQVPVAVSCAFASAWLMWCLPAKRVSLGSRATAIVLVLLGCVWLIYSYVFIAAPPPAVYGGQLVSFLARYSSYLDGFIQLLLAFGMVRLLLEDSKRETDAAHAELAIAHDRLMTESLKDSLTGTLNRRAFTEGIGLESAMQQYGAIAMLDLDDLKPVNDAYGHATGDRLLQHFAGVLLAGSRPTDKLYRWGGDEFLLVVPLATAENLSARLQKLLSNAEPLVPPVAKERIQIPLSVSFGCANYQNVDDIEATINQADTQMYEEKRQRKKKMPGSGSGHAPVPG